MIWARGNPSAAPAVQGETQLALEGRWRVVVLNDPVNLMSYVVMVFKKVFGFDDATDGSLTAEIEARAVRPPGRSPAIFSASAKKAESAFCSCC